jgi:hypothetical protein
MYGWAAYLTSANNPVVIIGVQLSVLYIDRLVDGKERQAGRQKDRQTDRVCQVFMF